MSQSKPKPFRKIQIAALLSFVAALIGILISAGGETSVEDLIARAGGSPVRSAALLVLLFALKSLTVIVPIMPLYIASGFFFPPVWAVTVSFLGITAALTVPYLLGRWSGAEAIDYVKEKYPKIDKLIAIQQKNEFLASFIVRMIGWFPSDVVGYYFGACRTKYPVYLVSALFGCAIGVVTNTLLGDVLMDPFSKSFLVLMAIKLLISGSSAVIAYLLNRKKE